MLASYVLLLFLPLATNAICPTTLPTDASFATGAQYHSGDYGSVSSVHLLSLSPSAPSSFSLAYNLVSGSFMKAPSTQCPQSCLNRLRAMGKPGKDGSSSSIIMMWDAAGQSPPGTNLLYAAYTTTVLPGEYLYCSNVAGTCGASVPLYLYYNAETDDYQLRGDRDTVDDAAARLQNMGLPVCWMFPALQTTSSSTSTVTNGTRIRLARGANESNETNRGKPIQTLPNDLTHPNNSQTEDQRSKIGTLPAWYNSTNRPTVTSAFPSGHRTGTTSGTVSMDPGMGKGKSADSIRPYGEVKSRDGNETATATKRSEGEMSQGGVDLLGKGFGKERVRELLEKGKNATRGVADYGREGGKDLWGTGSVADFGRDLQEMGKNTNGSVTDIGKDGGRDLIGMGRNTTGNDSATDQKDLRSGGEWGRLTGIISDVNVSAIEQMRELGRGRMEKALGNGPLTDQMKEQALSALGMNGGNGSEIEKVKELGSVGTSGNGSSTDQTKERNGRVEKEQMREMGSDLGGNDDQPKDKQWGGVNLGSILGGVAGGRGGKTVGDLKEEMKEKAIDKTGNGTEVVKKKWPDTNGHFANAREAFGIENMGKSNGSNATGIDELADKEKNGFIERVLASLGIDVPSNVSSVDVLKALGKENGQEKNGMIEKALTSLRLDIPSNVSVSDIMKELVKDKSGMAEKTLTSLGFDVNVSKYDKDNGGKVSVVDLVKGLGKDKIEKALSSLGIDVPSNFSANDLLKNLGKEEKDKNSDGKKFTVIDLVKGLGKDKIEKALTSLGFEVPSNFSATELMNELGKEEKDKNSDGKKFTVIDLVKDLGKDKIEKALTSLGFEVPSNFSASELLKELGKDNNGGDFLHVLNSSLNVLDEEKPDGVTFEKLNRTLDSINEKTLVAVEKILGRFNTSLAQVHPSFSDNNTSILIATIPFPRKMNEQELAQARNETAHLKELRVFEDRLIVYGGDVDVEAKKDASVEIGAWSPGPTGEPRGTRRGTEGTRNQSGTSTSMNPTEGESKQSNQTNQSIQSTVAIQIVTDGKGSSTTTSSGSSTSTVSGSTTTTVLSGVEGASSTTTVSGSSTTSSGASDAYTGSSTTTTPYTGPPTTSTTVAVDPAASSTTTTPYTDSPTTSTTAAPYTGSPTTTTTPLPYTGPPTTSTTAAPYTGPSTTADPAASTTTASPGSSMSTVRPTTTTSPYVYAATTDAAGTFGSGDQKLENGTVVRPNGDTIYPNGTVKTGDGAIIEGGKKTDVDGTVHNPDGSTKYPNGTVVYPSDATPVGSGGGKNGDDTPAWVIPVIIVGSMIVGVASLAMIVFGVTSMMKGAPPSAVNPYAVPNSREQWPSQRQPTPDLPPPVAEPVMTAQPQSFGATQTLAGGPNPLYFG